MNHECKPESQLPPDLLLNVHQQNNAWGFRYHGVLLDPFSGEASYYEMTDRSRVGSLDWQKPTSTWDQILERQTFVKKVSTLDPSERRKFSRLLMDGIQSGQPSEKRALDAGTTTVAACSSKGCVVIGQSGTETIVPRTPEVFDFLNNLLRSVDGLPPIVSKFKPRVSGKPSYWQ
jgi:hypothetical protein